MTDRIPPASVLADHLQDPEVKKLVEQRLSKEQIALLIVISVNPYYEVTTADKSLLAGVSERSARRR